MDAEMMLSAARFSLVATGSTGREESCLDGFVRCNGAETEFFLRLPDGDKIDLKINEDFVVAERSGRENYIINFFKKKENASTLYINNAQMIKFLTHKLLFRKTDNTFELYLSYDLSGTAGQSLKIKCTKL